MLNELLRHNSLGDADEISFVLFDALIPNSTQSISDVRKYCSAHLFSISPSFDGIIGLLAFVGIVASDNHTISIDSRVFDPATFDKSAYFQTPHFFDCLLKRLSELGCEHELFNADNLRFSHSDGQYYVKSHLISLRFFPVRNLLLRLGFLQPDGLVPDHLFVSRSFTHYFKDTVIVELESSPKLKMMRADQLNRLLEQKADLGKRGELFVLAYEQSRLMGHREIDKIKRIADDYVNAGYDITSFDNLDSFINDRFIEVKTYVNEIAFYWSKQEVEKAKTLRAKYWLYLVDDSRAASGSYTPKMIQNPYSRIFENDEWKKETEKWRISLEVGFVEIDTSTQPRSS